MVPRLSAASLRTPSCGTPTRPARVCDASVAEQAKRRHGEPGKTRSIEPGSAKLCKSESGVSPGLVPSTDWLAFRDSACAALTQGAGLHDGFDSGQKDLRRDYRTHLPQPNRRHVKQSCLQPKITLAPAPAVARVLPWPRAGTSAFGARSSRICSSRSTLAPKTSLNLCATYTRQLACTHTARRIVCAWCTGRPAPQALEAGILLLYRTRVG